MCFSIKVLWFKHEVAGCFVVLTCVYFMSSFFNNSLLQDDLTRRTLAAQGWVESHPLCLGCCLSMMVEKNLGNISQVDRHVWFLTEVGETIT